MPVDVGQIQVTVGANIRPLQQGLAQAQQSMNGFAESAKGMAMNALSFAGGMALMQVFTRGVDAAKGAVIDFNAELEQLQVSFEVMLHSATRASSLLKDLQTFAASTPFEFPQLIFATKQLLNARVSAEQLIPILTSIGDVSQGQADKIGRLTVALTQVMNLGRLSGEEMRQFSEAGVSQTRLFEIMAQKTGKSIDDMKKAMEKGQISSKLFVQSFREMAAADFGGMMEKQAQTFNGAISTITDSVRGFVSTAFNPLFVRLRDVAVQLANTMSKGTGLDSMARMTAGYVDVILRAYGILVQGIATAMNAIIRIVVAAAVIVLRALSYLNPFARHSPSLIDVMEEGFGKRIPAILADMNAQIIPLLATAGEAMEAFKQASAGGVARAQAMATAETEKQVALLGGGAVDAYRAATAALAELETSQTALADAIKAEETSLKTLNDALRETEKAHAAASKEVARLANEMTKAQDAMSAHKAQVLEGTRAFEGEIYNLNRAGKQLELEIVTEKLSGGLERARARVAALRESLERARSQLQHFSSAALVGTRAYADALYANDLAVKRLQYSVLGLRDVLEGRGPNPMLEANEDAMNAIQLRMNQMKLGGGDTEGEEFKGLEASLARLQLLSETIRLQDTMDTTPARRQLEAANREIAAIGRNSERIRLHEALTLDPQRRALRDLLDTSKELTFEEARAGVVKWLAETNRLEGALKGAERAEKARAAHLADLEARLSRIRLLTEQAQLKWDLKLDEFERLKAILTDARVETTPALWAQRFAEINTSIGQIKTQMDAAKVVQDDLALKAEAQRVSIQTQNDGLTLMRERYAEIAAQAGLWRQEMDKILAAAQQIDAAMKAAAKAGGGDKPPPMGADIPEGLSVGTGWATKMDKWQEDMNDPFRKIQGEWIGPLAELETQVKKLTKPLEDAATAMSNFAKTGDDLTTAFKVLKQTYDTEIVPLQTGLVTWWNGPGKTALDAFITTLNTGLVGALTLVKDTYWTVFKPFLDDYVAWQTGAGRTSTNELDGWWREQLPGAMRAFGEALAIHVLGPLGAIGVWYATGGREELGKIRDWFNQTFPTAFEDFQRAWKLNISGATGFPWISAWWIGEQGKILLDLVVAMFKGDLPGAMEAFGQSMKNLVAPGGPFEMIYTALQKVVDFLNRLKNAWGEYKRSLLGTPTDQPPTGTPGEMPKGDQPNPPSPPGNDGGGRPDPPSTASALRDSTRLVAAATASAAAARPATQSVVVNVAGSVTTERDLATAIRAELLRTGRRNGFEGSLA